MTKVYIAIIISFPVVYFAKRIVYTAGKVQ